MRAFTAAAGVFCVSWLVLAESPRVAALNEPSHEIINGEAATRSPVDQVLKEQLGIPEGIRRDFRGIVQGRPETNSALRWIERGGRLEDVATFFQTASGRARFFRHFHDPLRPWDSSGLFFPLTTPPRFTRYESSVRWAQQENQDSVSGQGNFAWGDARRYFSAALTHPDWAIREQAFADTFRALGQVMHLIVDASVPEHTRNDVHPLGEVFGSYEYWVEGQHAPEGTGPGFIATFLRSPLSLDPDLLKIPIPSTEPIARVPIARLFDGDRYTGTNPEVTAQARIGIAETANANFVSEDTGHGEYPHPALSNMDKYVGIYSKLGDKRAYYKMKPGFGLGVNPVATECALNELTGFETLCVDNDVWRETAWHMLPRAVSYSTALLDYFFRGVLDVKREADPETGLPSLSIVNRSPEPLGERGTLTLYQDNDQRLRSPVPGASLELSAAVPKDNDEAPLRLPLPTDLPEAGLTLVYEGPLGVEPKAVIGKALAEIAVEQVYRDWATNEWILRTKDDLYVLPLESAAGLRVPLAQVTWGDRDNQLVGLTAPTGDGPYEALLFELDRPLGSSMVRTTGEVSPSGLPIAVVRRLNRIALYDTLSVIDLKTSATISIRREVAQYVITYTSRQTCDWREGAPGWSGAYDCTITIGGDTLTRARSWSDTLQYEFQLRLTPEQHATDRWAERPPKYWWTLEQVRADRNGHVVAVVEIAGPRLAPEDIRSVPLRAFDQDGSLVESEMSVTVGGDLDPINYPAFRMTVVVDLTTGQLLGKTATDSIVLDLTDRIVVPGTQGPFCVAFSETAEFRGGYLDGETLTYRNGYCRNGSFFGIPVGTPRQVALTIPDREGMYADRAEGLVRDSLAAIGLGVNPAAASPPPDPRDLAYRWSADGTTAIVLRLPGEPASLPLGEATWKRWFGPTPGRLGLWVVSPTASWTEDTPVSLVRWNLKEDTASVIYNEASDDPPFPIMSNVGGVLTVRDDDDGWLWIPWRGATAFIPDLNEFDAWDYVALDPDYLYSVETGYFHALRPGLPEEAGPPPLVFSDETEGEYHVVGR